jgi:hypothetical protein
MRFDSSKELPDYQFSFIQPAGIHCRQVFLLPERPSIWQRIKINQLRLRFRFAIPQYFLTHLGFKQFRRLPITQAARIPGK